MKRNNNNHSNNNENQTLGESLLEANECQTTTLRRKKIKEMIPKISFKILKGKKKWLSYLIWISLTGNFENNITAALQGFQTRPEWNVLLETKQKLLVPSRECGKHSFTDDSNLKCFHPTTLSITFSTGAVHSIGLEKKKWNGGRKRKICASKINLHIN